MPIYIDGTYTLQMEVPFRVCGGGTPEKQIMVKLNVTGRWNV
jgi:hypothetical protein